MTKPRPIADVLADLDAFATELERRRQDEAIPLIEELEAHLPEDVDDLEEDRECSVAWDAQGGAGQALAQLQDVARCLRVVAGFSQAKSQRALEDRRRERVEWTAKHVLEARPVVASLLADLAKAQAHLSPWRPQGDELISRSTEPTTLMFLRLSFLYGMLSQALTEMQEILNLARAAGALGLETDKEKAA